VSWRGYAYIAPNFLGFLVFTALPVLAVGVMAFFQGSFTTRVDPVQGTVTVDARPCGFDNFTHLVKELDPKASPERPEGGELYRALKNTLVLLLAVPIQMAAALALAMLLNRKIRGRVVYRTLLFLPTIASGIALFLVWRWLYNKDFGLLNAILAPLYHLLDTPPPDWLGSKTLAKPALIIMGVWMAMGGTTMVLFLAGLQGIDPTLYEAAEIDGAGAWAKFRHVTWPELRPTTFFILTTNLIGGFQIFDQVYIMCPNGGPEYTTTTILYYIYENMYVFEGKLGYASAVAIFLFLLIFLVTLANYAFSAGGARAVRS
jgi:multiple sugar transport system permease protein